MKRTPELHGKLFRAVAAMCWIGLSGLAGCDASPGDPTPEFVIRTAADSILVGDTMTAVAATLGGEAMDGQQIEWFTSSVDVLEVDSSGLIVGHAEGTAVVVADLDDQVASKVIQVVGQRVGWSEIGVSCGRRVDGTLWCWERTDDGPKGPLTMLPFENSVAFFSGPFDLPFDCVLDRDRRAFCRGNNFMGQLGSGDTEFRENFVAVSGNARFQELDLESAHACGVTSQGGVLCWGANMTGQIGRRGGGAICHRTRPISCHLTPVEIALPAPAAAVTVGGDINYEGDGFTCAVLVDHRTYCWGANHYGQAGRDRSVGWFAEPHEVSGAPPFKRIDAGNNHVCGIDLSDQVWCWGRGNGGLGVRLPATPEHECWSADVVFACTSHPVRINSGRRFLDVAASYDVTCAATIFGGTYCWGDNQVGQLGTGVKGGDHGGNITDPVAISSPLRLRALAASHSLNCGVTADGRAYCWGAGQATPTPVPDPPLD